MRGRTKIQIAIGIALALLIAYWLIFPKGERLQPITEVVNAIKSTPQASPKPSDKPTPNLTYVPAEKKFIGGMSVGDTGFTYPGAIVAFGEHRLYIDPSSSIKSQATAEYPIKVERKTDGFYVQGRKYIKEWRTFDQSVSVSMNLEPITKME